MALAAPKDDVTQTMCLLTLAAGILGWYLFQSLGRVILHSLPFKSSPLCRAYVSDVTVRGLDYFPSSWHSEDPAIGLSFLMQIPSYKQLCSLKNSWEKYPSSPVCP